MSDLSINAVTFNGTPLTGNAAAWRPTGITAKEQKIGVTLEAANGTRNRVERGANKHVWDVVWEGCNLATMQTVRTIARLATSFTFVDNEGVSFTVQTEDQFAPAWLFDDAGGASYWSVTLTLYQV